MHVFFPAYVCLGLLSKPLLSMVSCQKGPTRHAYAWQIGPFWQDTLDVGVLGYMYTENIAITGTLHNFSVCVLINHRDPSSWLIKEIGIQLLQKLDANWDCL